MPKKPKVDPAVFRLYPDAGTLYFRVLAWPDRDSMLRYLRKADPARYPKGEDTAVQAVCRNYDVFKVDDRGRSRRLPICGDIVCHRGRLDAEIVSHEVAHAALWWARRVGVDVNSTSGGLWASDDEERFCYANGRMVQQFANRAYQLGLWTRAEESR